MMSASPDRSMTMSDAERLLEYAEQSDIADDPLVIDLVRAVRDALEANVGA